MVFLFDKRSCFFLSLIFIPLFFLPKINLIGFKDQSAGIRFDDIVLIFLGGALLFAIKLTQKKLHKIELMMLIFIATSLISFSINMLIGFPAFSGETKTNLFYAIRPLEYFLFFYLGGLAGSFKSSHFFVKVLFYFNLLIMGLQFLGLIGGITVDGYQRSFVNSRIPGIASFPSEMGLLINVIYSYIAFSKDTSRNKLTSIFKACFLFVVAALLVILTGNRISILALFLCFMAQLYSQLKSVPFILKTSLGFILMSAMLSTIFLVNDESSRSSQLFSFSNLRIVTNVWDSTDLNRDPLEKLQILSNCDASWWLRLHKWCFATKAFLEYPLAWFIGLGPGFCGPALDGGILRILTETGLVGFSCFFMILLMISKISFRMMWVIFAFCINLVFFDAYMAYKVMSLIYFLAGLDLRLKPLIAPLIRSQPL